MRAATRFTGVVNLGDGVYPFGGNIGPKSSGELRSTWSCGVAGFSSGESDVIYLVELMEGRRQSGPFQFAICA